jgi:DedD protein
MGLFSRKEAKSSRHAAHRPRPSVSSEAQAASLRVRARRRLAGAVALVLAAVIILPVLLDGEPRPVPTGIDIAVPERNAPFNPQLSPPPLAGVTDGDAIAPVSPGLASSTSDSTSSGTDVPTTDLSASAAAQANQAEKPASAATPSESSAPASTPTAKPDPKSAAAAAAATPVPTPAAKPDKTAEALAILEGRAPPAASSSPQSASATTEAFVVQVASYGSEPDAKSRVEKLKSQGISNAFLETATVSGKPTYRLRVGPFDSRSAAQAAQARLRTLGYDNGFITTK